MRMPRSIQWRIALAYAALIVAAMAMVTLVLVLDLRDELIADPGDGNALERVLRVTGTATVVVTALAVVIAVIIARRSTRSIRHITEAARRLAGGNLDYHVLAPGSSEETRELVDSLNAMAGSLKDKLAEANATHQRLSAVLATMTGGVVLLDANGRISLVNPAASALLAMPTSSPRGQRFIEAVRDHEINSMVIRCQRLRQPDSLEIEFAPSKKFLNIVAMPLSGQYGEGMLLVVHDLTEARRVEITRKAFVANVSHELRTPLASVKASVETLEGGALDDAKASREFLERIRRNADRMSRLVGDLLDLSRLESGEDSLNLESIDIYRPINEAAELHKRQAEEKGVELMVLRGESIPPALADESRIQQVIINLVENAVKFTPRGGRVLVVARSANGAVEVTIQDTGIGIASEHLPHAFERFYKVDRSRSDTGTGLGLAIAKHIVQAHGGRIWAESNLGEGSTFGFTLPAANRS
jgi:two-component system phosphate regulon sensor histidine kinase PhoR